MIDLIRVPSKRLAQARPEYRATMNKYDYTTPDGRWYVQKDGGCGGGWSVIDTTGEYVCTSCRRNPDGHAASERTLSAAKAFILEWTTTYDDDEYGKPCNCWACTRPVDADGNPLDEDGNWL